MRLSDLRIGWRLLARDRLWSGSAIAGLAVGFAACFLLLGYVAYSFSYDDTHPDPDRVYLVKTRFHFPGVPEEWSEQATQVLRGTVLEQRLADDVTMYAPVPAALVAGGRTVAAQVTLVDPVFAAMMGVRVLAGDATAALARPDSLVLTVTAARKLFGRETDIVGQLVTAAGERLVVGALVADPPAATTVPYEMLAGSGSPLWAGPDRDDATQNWGRLFGRVYVKLRPGADAAALAAALQRASDASPLHGQLDPAFLAQLGDKALMDVGLVRLRDAYLDPDLAKGARLHGDRPVLFAVAALALLILLLAAINYVNLATVRTLRRQREIAISKVLGARAGQVVTQFLAESVLVTLAATVLGLLCAWRLMPWFGELMNRPMDGFVGVPVFATFLALGLLTGGLAGLHPAWVALRVKPAAALAGRHNQESRAGLRMRRALTVLQLASAMALAGVTLGVAWQTWHVLTADPGFDARAKLVIDAGAPFTEPDARVRSFIEAVRHLPGVAGVGQSLEAVGRNDIVQKGTLKRAGSAPITIEWKGVAPSFLAVYGVRPLAGRIFDDGRDGDAGTSGLVLAAAAARALGFATPAEAIGQTVDGDGKASQVIGVVPDIRFQSLREAPAAVAYRLTRRAPVLAVAFHGNPATMEAAVEATWRQYLPDQALRMARQESLLAAHYEDDVRSVKLLAAAALLAILIAAMGVYVLSAYSVQRRTREIVLHRLYGASRADIVRLLGRETVLLLAVSAALGIPPALLALRHYLAGFVEPSGGWGWAIVLACAIAVLVAVLAVARGIATALALRPNAALQS
jgi:putative ABC transport system permease protein